MNIQERFLLKAIEDKNYISFMYKNKKYTKVKALKLITEDKHILKTQEGNFEFDLITKIIILKERF
ncbi:MULTISPECIES: hypothetical protein [Arcobacteraceae]|uniref:Uncharacterized protein n=1 Tax=Poseidonibacter parvus TaxID=1850254 RepID=A0A1P8KQH2_9BACT|nr:MULTISPECIES: hypothetical protein [Arcobacteraceae]APW66862.1 hypothetical protein LPB137_13820 [Poseidonibacter parvus]